MSTFLDERSMTLLISPSGLRHVQGWWNQTVCGKSYDNQWRWHDRASLRWLGKMAQSDHRGYFCKRCASHYKDIKED